MWLGGDQLSDYPPRLWTLDSRLRRPGTNPTHYESESNPNFNPTQTAAVNQLCSSRELKRHAWQESQVKHT